MTVPELLPHVKALSHDDKLRLLGFLVSELLSEAGLTTEHPISDATNELRQSFQAAEILSKALMDHQAAKHG